MKKLLFFIPLFLLFSCSVQKRKYQKGFYVSNFISKSQSKKNNSVFSKNEIRSENLITKTVAFNFKNKNEINEVEASANKNSQPLVIHHLPSFGPLPTDSCDIIILKNGDEVSAKVLEISPIEIKYKKCIMPDGPLYIVKKTDVFMVKYLNGTKEVFKTEAPAKSIYQDQNAQTNKYQGPKRTHPLAIVAIICTILGIFTYGIGFVLGSIFANIALRKIREQPDKYKGETLAKVAKIIGLVVIGIVFALFLLAVLTGL